MPSGSDRNSARTNRTQDLACRSSQKSSHNLERQDWSDMDIRQTDIVSGMLDKFYTLCLILL